MAAHDNVQCQILQSEHSLTRLILTRYNRRPVWIPRRSASCGTRSARSGRREGKYMQYMPCVHMQLTVYKALVDTSGAQSHEGRRHHHRDMRIAPQVNCADVTLNGGVRGAVHSVGHHGKRAVQVPGQPAALEEQVCLHHGKPANQMFGGHELSYGKYFKAQLVILTVVFGREGIRAHP